MNLNRGTSISLPPQHVNIWKYERVGKIKVTNGGPVVWIKNGRYFVRKEEFGKGLEREAAQPWFRMRHTRFSERYARMMTAVEKQNTIKRFAKRQILKHLVLPGDHEVTSAARLDLARLVATERD
ncbi:hypothetical protein EVAR_86108_1 [Eumeta japonica]|uniref:Uncharacterized protein n=1 Tax=Eumeta variegata TaxID=151549 RepID=A0A4C1V1T0_EUMVA|nr:hypothetical protein EVAR_86108_1 [Eumeta japonica]